MDHILDRPLRNGLIRAGEYNIHFALESLGTVGKWLENHSYSSLMVLCDQHTHRDCYPMLEPHLPPHALHIIQPGDRHKNVEQLGGLWQAMTDAGCDRHSILLNLGGGMVGDLGGFGASSYKRGIRFIQVPTSLLAMADASVGGKTGINLGGYKNQVGQFANPSSVFIYSKFLETLPPAEMRSGWAELLKHGLIADKGAWNSLRDAALDADWTEIVPRSIQIKLGVVTDDPLEEGPRKALNFGHTVGHALESWSHEAHGDDALRHGEAVALGMVAESWLSLQREFISPEEYAEIRSLILAHFPLPEELKSAQARAEVAALCLQDKKNRNGEIRCTLLKGIGHCKIDQKVSLAEVEASLAELFD